MSKSLRTDDELLVTPFLKRRLATEGRYADGDGSVWALLQRSNGQRVEILSQAAQNWNPLKEQRDFGHLLCELLNGQIRHDGRWVVGFTHPSELTTEYHEKFSEIYYNRWFALWIDNDGDPQFTMDCENRFDEVTAVPIFKWVSDAEEAWQKWKHHMRDVLGTKRMEQISVKRAQGQEPSHATGNTVH